jgi:hypothetical protein
MITISFINASSVVADGLAERVMNDLQTQVTRDFFPVWGVDAVLDFVGHEEKPPASTWWLSLLDNSDTAGALGYHDLTSAGQPIGKAFVKTSKQNQTSWTVDASHELLEMLADPDINLCCMNNGSTLYAYEVGDPVQDDACGYMINDTLVSDFVYPAFFEPSRGKNSTQFDRQKKVNGPLTLAPGGYMSYLDFSSGQGWQQVTAELAPMSTKHRGGVGSRRERRRTARKDWVWSTV